MDFTEFKRKIDGNDVAGIYLLEGEEVFLKERAIDALKEKFVSCPDIDYICLEGSELSLEGLTPLVQAFPFMSEKRMVVVREFYPRADAIKGALKDVFTSPPNTTLLVIVNSKSHDQLKKQPSVTLVSCDRQSPAVIVKWIRREFLNNAIDISPDLASLIAEYSLLDMTKVNNEVYKLVSYLGDRQTVTLEDINAVVTKESEYRIYEMTDCVGRRDFDNALKILEELSASGEAPQKLLTSIYYYFRRLFHIALSDKSDKELAVILGAKEYAVTKTRKQLKFFKLKSLKKAVDTLSDFDYQSKSGGLSFDNALMLGVFKIMIE